MAREHLVFEYAGPSDSSRLKVDEELRDDEILHCLKFLVDCDELPQ